MEENRDMSRVVTIVQARMSSRQLPGKPMLPLGDSTVLEQVVRRIQAAQFGGNFLVITSNEESDRPIRELCQARRFPCYAGNHPDELERLLGAARLSRAEIVVRCLVNSPLLDPKMLDACARYALDSGMDYITVARLPQGVTSEAIPLHTLLRTAEMTNDPRHREEITTFAAANLDLFDRAYLPPPMRLARKDVRLLLETEEDYAALSRLYKLVPPRSNGLLSVEDCIAAMDNDPLLRQFGRNPDAYLKAA